MSSTTEAKDLYLALLKKVLTGVLLEDPPVPIPFGPPKDGAEFRLADRLEGLDWPSRAHTMVGIKRLDNVQQCVERALADGVPGDLIETGVWRGGTCIFMRALLKVHGVRDRNVWVADSFRGLPRSRPDSHPSDRAIPYFEAETTLAVAEETVRHNFELYGLLDDQVKFLPGWFRDTLPTAPVERLAVLRLDGDMYESTMDALTNLYPKLSVGGYCIIDDYGLDACQTAVWDFRTKENITGDLIHIDRYGAYWRRTD